MSTTSDASTNDLPKTHYRVEPFWAIVMVIVVGNFAGTMAAADQLAKIPLQNILKNSLHVTREDTAKFFFLASLFFYLKPLAGILTDAFPIFKTRRLGYIVASSAMAALAWVALAAVPKSYKTLLISVIVIDLFVVMISTVTGAFLVELGQRRGEVGRFTAVRGVARSVLFTVQSPIGGALAGISLWAASGVGAFVALSILPIALLYMREKRDAKPNKTVLIDAGHQVRTIARSWPFWTATGFTALFYFAPGFSTMAYYRQNDVLHLSQQTIGYLGAVGNVAGIAASLLYFFFARRLPIRTSLIIGVVVSAISQSIYVWYNSPTLAFIIDFQNGFFGTYAQVAIMDLAARSTPEGCEGLGYAFIMSILNLSAAGSDWLGSHLADSYHLSWNTMVCINAGTTLVSLVLIPIMPKAIMRGKDRGSDSTLNATMEAA